MQNTRWTEELNKSKQTEILQNIASIPKKTTLAISKSQITSTTINKDHDSNKLIGGAHGCWLRTTAKLDCKK